MMPQLRQSDASNYHQHRRRCQRHDHCRQHDRARYHPAADTSSPPNRHHLTTTRLPLPLLLDPLLLAPLVWRGVRLPPS